MGCSEVLDEAAGAGPAPRALEGIIVLLPRIKQARVGRTRAGLPVPHTSFTWMIIDRL